MYVWLMEAKLIEQAMTSGIALLSLLIVAVATAIATNAINRKQAERTREQEYATWLRNHKTEVYSMFLTAVRELVNECGWTTRGEERKTKMVTLVYNARPTLLSLVAPSEIRDLAASLYGACLWMTLWSYRDNQTEPHVVKWKTKVESELKQIEELFRKDLEYSPVQ